MPIKEDKVAIHFDKAYGPVIGDSDLRLANGEPKGYSNYGTLISSFDKVAAEGIDPIENLSGKKDFDVQDYEVFTVEFEK